MIFYQVSGFLQNIGETDENYREAEQKKFIASKTDEYNKETSPEMNFFITDIGFNHDIDLLVVSKSKVCTQENVRTYLKELNLEIKNVRLTEITYQKAENFLLKSHFNDFTGEDPDNIEGRLGIEKDVFSDYEFGENLIVEKSRADIEKEARMFLFDEDMKKELDRIYMGSQNENVYGHPVHYMIETDNPEVRKVIYRDLLSALYENKRLKSKRYYYLNMSFEFLMPERNYEILYDCIKGGTIVFRIDNKDLEGYYRDTVYEAVECVTKLAKKYSKDVLTVFCLPAACERIREKIYSNFGNLCFVQLCESTGGPEESREYLSYLARENNVEPDESLFAKIREEKQYNIAEFGGIFNEWYNSKLRSNVFPQYSGLSVVKEKIRKSKPSGNAYQELFEMVGLSEAKEIIQKALNYYKAQKMYAERGMSTERPAMHMIFTGNPGTAKTTVARLFARIMKDNGLLSTGKMVEVGRADLVGKYVGWTAKAVKQKFKEAQGGVLFIDEAYSLMDENKGSFGEEAINTIVQEMENNRDEVVVIFAGYPNLMEKFLDQNPGLRSRIAFSVPFKDYETEELCGIADLISKKKGFTISDDARKKLIRVFDHAKKASDFGNGRYVRNVLEKARMNQADRIVRLDCDKVTDEEITTIKACDIDDPDIKNGRSGFTFGFAG